MLSFERDGEDLFYVPHACTSVPRKTGASRHNETDEPDPQSVYIYIYIYRERERKRENSH